jgi:hypothetical protein
VSSEFTKIFQISNMLIGRDINYQISSSDEPVIVHDTNLFHSIKDIFPIQPQLPKFGSSCSINDDMLEGFWYF